MTERVYPLAVGVVALLAVLGAIVAAGGPGTGTVGTRLAPGLPTALLAILAVAAAALTGAFRFGLYAIALLALAGGTIAVGGGPVAPMAAGGLIVLVSGAILLGRFLRHSAGSVGEA